MAQQQMLSSQRSQEHRLPRGPPPGFEPTFDDSLSEAPSMPGSCLNFVVSDPWETAKLVSGASTKAALAGGMSNPNDQSALAIEQANFITAKLQTEQNLTQPPAGQSALTTALRRVPAGPANMDGRFVSVIGPALTGSSNAIRTPTFSSRPPLPVAIPLNRRIVTAGSTRLITSNLPQVGVTTKPSPSPGKLIAATLSPACIANEASQAPRGTFTTSAKSETESLTARLTRDQIRRQNPDSVAKYHIDCPFDNVYHSLTDATEAAGSSDICYYSAKISNSKCMLCGDELGYCGSQTITHSIATYTKTQGLTGTHRSKVTLACGQSYHVSCVAGYTKENSVAGRGVQCPNCKEIWPIQPTWSSMALQRWRWLTRTIRIAAKF